MHVGPRRLPKGMITRAVLGESRSLLLADSLLTTCLPRVQQFRAPLMLSRRKNTTAEGEGIVDSEQG